MTDTTHLRTEHAGETGDMRDAGHAKGAGGAGGSSGRSPEAHLMRGLAHRVREDLMTEIFAFRPLPPMSWRPQRLERLPAQTADALRRGLPWLPHAAVVFVALCAMWGQWARGTSVDYERDLSAVLAAWMIVIPPVLALFRPLAAFWLSLLMATVGGVITGGASPGEYPWGMPGGISHLLVLLVVVGRGRPGTAFSAWGATLLAGLLAISSGVGDGTSVVAVSFLSALALGFQAALRGWGASSRKVVERDAVVQQERTRRTVLEERSTMARELHDVVAHHMSVVAIQAEAAPYRVQEPPPELVTALATIRENAVAALTELRRVLGVVRSELPDIPDAPQPTLAELDALLDNVREAGLRAESVSTGSVRTLPQGVELSAYRIVQEALSNVLRHAPGASARVELSYVLGGLGLRVVNSPADRVVAPSPGSLGAAGSGHGVLGMRERASVLGGELTAGETADGGYEVEAFLPVTEAAPEPVADPAPARALAATDPPGPPAASGPPAKPAASGSGGSVGTVGGLGTVGGGGTGGRA